MGLIILGQACCYVREIQDRKDCTVSLGLVVGEGKGIATEEHEERHDVCLRDRIFKIQCHFHLHSETSFTNFKEGINFFVAASKKYTIEVRKSH